MRRTCTIRTLAETFFQSLGPLMGALTPAAVAADGGAHLDKLVELTDGPVGRPHPALRTPWAQDASADDVRGGRELIDQSGRCPALGQSRQVEQLPSGHDQVANR